MEQPVFLELGPRPEEHGRIVRPDARASYPVDVLASLEIDAKDIIGRYPVARSALLPLLHLVQAEDGYISPAGVEFCAKQLDLTGAEVAAVATFYSMYRRNPTGEYLVGVCTNTLCAVMGGDAILQALEEHLDIACGETTSDGKVTLEHVECNAACDFAPVVMVNWEFFDNQTPQSARSCVDALRSGEPVTPTRGATLCTFRQTARVLAGFPDDRVEPADAEVGGPTVVGLRFAREHGMTAPRPGNVPAQAPAPDESVAKTAADATKDEPAPAPSATVPPKPGTAETDPSGKGGA